MTKNSLPFSAPVYPEDFLNSATGPVTVPMTNDYLFRAMLQFNNKALKGLICSLLHLTPEEVDSVTVTNPIELGSAVDNKTFILDTRVVLNDTAVINLEMQVVNEHDWPERSLCYLCRSFGLLKVGEDYADIKPVIQISMLNFTLFPDHPEFYATYRLMNEKNHTVYSDKLRLSVVDLTCIDIATDEDRLRHIDKWAALFKASTWEEIKMLAKKDEYIREASNTAYQLTQDELIRMQCDARDDYIRRERRLERLKETEAQLAEAEALLEERKLRLSEQETQLAEQKTKLDEQNAQLDVQKVKLHEQNAQLDVQKVRLGEQSAQLDEQNALLTEKDALIAALQKELAQLKGN